MRRSRTATSPALGLAAALLLLVGCEVESSSGLLGCPAGSVSRNGRCTGGTDAGGGVDLALEVSTLQLDFAPTPIGASSQATFEIFNPNAVEAEVLINRLVSPAFVTPWMGALQISGGQRLLITVTFTPIALGPFTGRLELDTCGGLCPVEVSLRGEGVDESGGLQCGSANFGQVPVGQCRSRETECVNLGRQTLTVDRVDVTPTRAGFSAQTRPGQRILSGQSYALPLTFCPSQAGEAQAQARISFVGETFTASAQLYGFGTRDTGCQLIASEVVDFGVLAERRPAMQVIEFSNLGEQECRVTLNGLRPDSARAFRIDEPVMQFRLLAGRTRSFSVYFDGAAQGEYSGGLGYAVDDEPIVRFVELRAQVVGPGTPLVVTSRMAGPLTTLVEGEVPQWVGNQDDGYAMIPLGFPFTLFGRSVRTVYVSTNGFIAFSASRADSLQNQPLPSRVDPNHLIAWWWDDLNPGSARRQAVRFNEAPGPAGQAVLQIRFDDVPHFAQAGMTVSAEVRLYEGDNRLEVQYGEIGIPMGEDPFQASAGWEGPLGMEGADLLNCSPNCTTADWPRNTIYTYRDAP